MGVKTRNKDVSNGQNTPLLPGKLLVCLMVSVFKTHTRASAHINISSFNIEKQGKHFKAAQSRPNWISKCNIFLKSLLLCSRKYI